MIRFAKTLPACVGFALLAGYAPAQSPESPPTELKLEFLSDTAAPVIGHLGDPRRGLEVSDWRIEWPPDGPILTNAPEGLIQVWTPPSGGQPPLRHSVLNAGYLWTLSNNGKILCAGAAPFDKNGPRAASQDPIHAFDLTNRSKLWSLKWAGGFNNPIDGLAFSSDDRVILITSRSGVQRVLRVLDAATGRQLEQLPLSEPESRNLFFPKIVAWQKGFLLLRRPESGQNRLLHVQLDPLKTGVIPCPELDEDSAEVLRLSPDDTRLVIFGDRGYQILNYRGKQWEAGISGGAGYGMKVAFSPDSRLLMMTAQGRTQVIDLGTERIIKEMDEGWLGAAFAPKGEVVVIGEHSGLSTVDPKTWTTAPPPAAQHDCPVLKIIRHPDKRTLITADHTGVIVWDVATRKARAMLKGMRKETNLDEVVLADRGRAVIATDGRYFVRWDLPNLSGPAPAEPVSVVGRAAFDFVPGTSPMAASTDIFADAEGQRFITRRGRRFELRDLRSPQTVKTLNAFAGVEYFGNIKLMFLDANRVCVLAGFDGLQILDLERDQLTPVAGELSKFGARKGLWLGGGPILANGGENLRLMDATTGKVLHTFQPPSRSLSVALPTVSPDEKYLATSTGGSVMLWDMASHELLAVQPLLLGGIKWLEFADAQTLAVGRGHGAIELWSVEKLLKVGVDPRWRPRAQAATAAPGTPKPAYEAVSHLPEKPLEDQAGSRWTFHGDGSASVEGTLPSFGVLRVNGKPFTSTAVRYNKRLAKEDFRYATWVAHDGAIDGTPILVSRYFGDGANLWLNAAIDSFTNAGATAVEVTIDFEVQFPTDATGLLTAKSQRVSMPADGRFSLAKTDLWLGPADSGKPGDAVAVLKASEWSGPDRPEMHWDGGSKTVRLRYTASLPPGETRWLIHSGGTVKRPADGLVNVIDFPHDTDAGFMVPPGSHAEGINFGRPDLWEMPHEVVGFPSTMSWSSDDPKPKPEMDGLGLTWEVRRDLSRAGQLGAAGVHELWLGGRLPAFAAAGFLQWHVNGKLKMPESMQFHDSKSKVTVTRLSKVVEGGGSTVWLDTYTNPFEEAKEVQASYLTTFRSPVMAVWDAMGKQHAPGAVSGSAAALGGACAFVLKGEEQPATLLAFHQEGAAVAPTVRWISPTVVALDYTLKLGPKESAALLHGACQRPLAAFGGAHGAFADWLPLAASAPSAAPILNQTAPNKK